MAEHYRSEGHVDTMLTNVSVQTRNTDYIGDMIFPIINTPKASGLIATYPQSHWFRNGAQLRAPRTKSEGGGFPTSNTPYVCERVSFRDEWADEEEDNYDDPIRLALDGAAFVTDKIWLYREAYIATNFFAASKGWQDWSAGAEFVLWSNASTSNPLKDIDRASDAIAQKIAREGKVLTLGKEAWITAKWNPIVLDAIKYTQKGVVTADLFASLAELDKLLVGRAIQTTDPEGTAEASVTYTRVWGDSALLLYVPSQPSLRAPGAGVTLVWNRVPNAIQYIKRMRDEERECQIVEGNSYFTIKQLVGNAGVFFNNIT